MRESGSVPESGDDETSGGAPAKRLARARSGFNGASVLILVAAAAITAAILAFALYRPVPGSLVTAEEPAQVELVAEQLFDAREVSVAVRLGEESSLPAPVSGKVTGSTCEAGGVLSSGGSTFAIDGVPLVQLHTAVPLWRDLSFGTEGEDVAALQLELARLGYDVGESEEFDWQTWVAWDDLVEALDGETEYGAFSLAQVLWLPAAETPLASCQVPLGHGAAEGEPLVGLPARILSAEVKSLPVDLVEGARVLVVDETEVELDERGRLTPSGMAALAQTGAFASFARSPEDSTLQGEFRLAEGMTVYPIPPAAVAMTDETSGCVVTAGGEGIAVTVVASKLGRSYISFEHAPHAGTVLEARAGQATECS